MKPLCPRHKRLKRGSRLQAAKHWLQKYEGKSIVKGYSKHFGVNMICAALERRMLGYEISKDYLENLKVDEVRRQKLNGKRKREKKINFQSDLYQDSDETFNFIAGYTSNGVPYGLTWDELQHESEDFGQWDDSDKLPF